MCWARLAANTGRKKSPKSRHLATIPQLCRAISSQLRHVSTIGKNLLNSNIFSTCPHNIANFYPVAAEIGSRVWGTPANSNVFRVLASLLQRRRSPEVNQTLHDVWPSPGLLHSIYIFGGCYPWRNFATCKIHFALKSCVPNFAVWYKEWNYGTELSQRAPSIFGWAAITLGIGPHSSYQLLRVSVLRGVRLLTYYSEVCVATFVEFFNNIVWPQINSWFFCWKNCENRSVFGEVTGQYYSGSIPVW